MAGQPPTYASVQPQQQPQVVYVQQPPAHQQQPQVVYVQQPQVQPVVVQQPPQQPAYYAQQPPVQPQYAQAPPQAQPQYNQSQVPQDIPPQDEPPQDRPPSAADSGYGTSEFGERLDYVTPVYKDKIWAIIWLVHLTAMIVLLLGSFGAKNVGGSASTSGFMIVLVCGAMGVAMGYLWTVIIRRYGALIIKFMMWATLVMMCISCIMSFASGNLLWGVISIIFIVLFALYMRAVWHRIPFAAAMMQIASDIIKLYPGTIWTALLMLALQMIWVFVWGGVVSIMFGGGDVGGSYVMYFFLMLSLYWNLETFKNLAHATVCGVAGAWYFSPYPQEPTKGALKRACTSSLGSVAFGSLLVSIIQAIRALLRQAVRQGDCNACLVCLIDCFLRCIERWVEFFNKYAYAHVSIYGEAFIPAAKQTWQLLQSKGMDAWINDDLIGFALVCGAMIGGFVCAAVGGLMVKINSDVNDQYISAFALVGFFIGFYLCWTVLHIVASCVVAIYVCFAEDPNAMEINRTSDYHKLTAARAGMEPNEYEEQMNQQQSDHQQYGNSGYPGGMR
eukprot:66339_1